MSKSLEESDPSLYSPISTEYLSPFSSVVDITMSRVDLDPSLRGEREADVMPTAGAGLLGATCCRATLVAKQ